MTTHRQPMASYSRVGGNTSGGGGGGGVTSWNGRAGVVTLQTTDVTALAITLDQWAAAAASVDFGNHNAINMLDPITAQMGATKNYVDTVATGLNPQQGCYAASTANIAGTYANGSSGIGATFTLTATGALSLDGVSPPANARVLLKDQSSGLQNGVYNVTVVGSVGVSPVLTRALDYDTPTDVNAGDLIPVENGTANSVTTWLQTATIANIGVDALTFVKFSRNPTDYLLAANNLSDVANVQTSQNNLKVSFTSLEKWRIEE